MKFHRVYAMILRYMYNFKHSYDRISDAFYWPTLDLFLWGLTSAYFQSHIQGNSLLLMAIVSAILLWIIIWRAQYEITVNLLVELWDKNLINIFGAPLKFSEWVTSVIIVGVLKALMSFLFASGVAFLMYKTQIFTLGFHLLPFILLLILSGWWMGFVIAGLILRYGTKIQTLAWTVVWAFAPFSALYYPVSALPDWAESVAKFVPTSYVFEGLREVIQEGHLSMDKIFISLGLNLFYLILSIIFLKKSFNALLKRGLARLY